MTRKKDSNDGAVHFHAIAGLHGCMPMVNEVCECVEDAAGVLADVHELGINRARRLRIDRYLELNLHRDGNEYAKIVECQESDCLDEESPE